MIDLALERQRERLLAFLLRYGSYLGCTAIALGLLLSWKGNSGLYANWSLWMVSGGIALLIGLPVLRLAVLLATFAVERDYRFAGATAAVLAIIAASLAVGLLLPK